jgi:serine/threonine protein phosphatase PrpC
MIQKIKQKFTNNDQTMETDEDVGKMLIDSFVGTNNELNQKLSNITELSGSTGVGVLIYNNKFYCANVGDSEAGLLIFKNGTPEMQMLSVCHLPNLPEERDRIKKVGGRIEAYRLPDGTHIGPPRVWRPHEDIPGLMMSRTFGDRIGHSCGISEVPGKNLFFLSKLEIISALKGPEHKCLVVGSDGVWEV